MKTLIAVAFFIMFQSYAEPERQDSTVSPNHAKKRYISWTIGFSFNEHFKSLLNRFSFTAGRDINAKGEYFGSLEVGIKSFGLREEYSIVSSFVFKYLYSLMKTDSFEFGPDVSVFFGGIEQFSITHNKNDVENGLSSLVIGNEFGLYAAVGKWSIIRAGFYTENLKFNRKLFYFELGLRAYIL